MIEKHIVVCPQCHNVSTVYIASRAEKTKPEPLLCPKCLHNPYGDTYAGKLIPPPLTTNGFAHPSICDPNATPSYTKNPNT